MTDTERELAELECEMNALVGLRNQRVTAGQAMIDSANRDFDEQAIPLGREINRLRGLVETEKQIDALSCAALTPADKIVTVTRTVRESAEPDPEWSQEDIDHFKELRDREPHKARSARR